MHTRREFIAGSLTGLATAALAPSAFAGSSWPPLGVQLYTVRKQVQADLPGTLAAIRKIGYSTVETFADQYRTKPRDLRKTILNAGLHVPSGHFNYDSFDSKYEYAKQLGLKYMVCASVPESLGSSLDGFKRAADQYNRWGAKTAALGMQFAFHNHNTEFQTYGGATGIDTLLQHTDPRLVHWEMDCYWVAQAGYSPIAMLRKYPGRVQLLHLKDREAGAKTSLNTGPGSQYFTEVGSGTLNWREILPLARNEGARYMFVEQDVTQRPPLESLRISYQYLQGLIRRS